jgi:predicted AAA+ superfamily ATPase
MFPFVPEEIGPAFRLDRALTLGTVPLVWDSEEPVETLKAYVRTYLKEEIQAEAAVRNLPGFSRFLPIAGLMHGQTLNVASLARDSGVARQTVSGYLEILEDTLLAVMLRAFEAKLRVRERRHPKLYFFDAGVARAIQGSHGALAAQERGALLEGFVFMLLRFYQERAELFDDVAYWAPTEARATEVDFVLTRGRELLALEVKTTRAVRPTDLSGLRAIAELRGVVRRILVHLGGRRLELPDGIEVWSFEHFMRALAEAALWPEGG